MARTVWIALVFLIFICGLATLKVGIATPVKQQEAFTESASVADLQPVVFKADKLNASYLDEVAPDKKTVRIIPIVLQQATRPEPKQKVTGIVSRHWHEGGSKVINRTARYHRDASRNKRMESKKSSVSIVSNQIAGALSFR